MEDEANVLDPYSAPLPPEAPVVRPGLSGGLKAIAIIGIVLGTFGLGGAVMGGIGLVLNGRMQSMFNGRASGPAGAQNAVRFQQELQRRFAETTNRFRVALVAQIFFQFLIAGLLLVGGIMVLMAKPRGRVIFRAACGLAILYQLWTAALTTMIQLANVRIMREMSEQMFSAGQGGPPPEVMSTVMTAAMYAGIAIALAFVLVKLVYYGIAVSFLGKESVRAQFAD